MLAELRFTVHAMPTLADRVKEAIEISGVSVSAIAERCGITPQSVYQWISGETKEIDGGNLVELAELTGYEARWIAKEAGPKKRIYARTPEQAHVLQVMQRMNGYEARLLVKITDTIPPPPTIPPSTGSGSKKNHDEPAPAQ